MLHLVLFRPEIPQNTGNIGRLCALNRARLHLIHPLGFKITDRHLKRSGMDYWKSLDVVHHENWEAFQLYPARPKRLWLLTTKAEQTFWDVKYEDDDGLLFGNEGGGAPAWLHEAVGPAQRIRIPQPDPTLRSLNLSTAAGIATYEVMRQWRSVAAPA